MENVFLSVGMKGRRGEDIDRDLGTMVELYIDKYGDQNVRFIDNFSCARPDYNNQKAWWLGEAIKKLGDCDTILMMYGWEHAKGCHVELEFARQYGLKILEVYVDSENGNLNFGIKEKK